MLVSDGTHLCAQEQRPPSILVVEDEHDLRWLVALILEHRGYHVLQAGDGAEALKLLRSGVRPDLILLDREMPVMNGPEFCAVWRADSELASVPVVLLDDEQGVDRVAARCGTTRWAVKPRSRKEVLAIAEGCLRTTRL